MIISLTTKSRMYYMREQQESNIVMTMDKVMFLRHSIRCKATVLTIDVGFLSTQDINYWIIQSLPLS